MTKKKGKTASRHRKIEKTGYQAAAKMILFPRRWHGGMISANQEAMWGMSVKASFAERPVGPTCFSYSFDKRLVPLLRESTL